MNKRQIRKFQKKLQFWYETNKRILPWRETKEPYKIWISEIILQQTRVNQGFEYYVRFIERFPNVKSLAEADEQEVLKYWQGLGYYSRARNLHKAAKKIVSDFNAQFPKTHKDIISLPGIGEYTAAAISSFAYNLPYAAVDGNIYRVLSRISANDTPIDTTAGKKVFTEIAQNLLDKLQPGLHNQAIMEFGAIYCTPANPDCQNCPLLDFCEAKKLNLVQQLPVKQSKTKVTNRYFNYFFIQNGKSTYLQKRTKKDIWRNLYEFPLIETDGEMDFSSLVQTPEFKTLFENTDYQINKISKPFKHVLSHQIIYANFYNVSIVQENKRLQSFEKTKLSNLYLYPISRLTELFLESIEK